MTSNDGKVGTNEQEMLDIVRDVFVKRIPFNRVFGLEMHELSISSTQFSFNMRDELVGNYLRGNLHGGVISSVLDVAGGLESFLGIIRRNPEEEPEARIRRFARLGTIDLRVDYLRPGIGKRFTATAETMRSGNRVTVVRMKLHNENNELIAVGTGAYVVG